MKVFTKQKSRKCKKSKEQTQINKNEKTNNLKYQQDNRVGDNFTPRPDTFEELSTLFMVLSNKKTLTYLSASHTYKCSTFL